MKKFEALTLEEAYAEAAKEFSCSITELEIQIIQNPTKGFLGIGRKPAIIVAQCKKPQEKCEKKEEQKNETPKKERNIDINSDKTNKSDKSAKELNIPNIKDVKEHKSVNEEADDKSADRLENQPIKEKMVEENSKSYLKKEREIFDNFYTESLDIDTVVNIVEEEINRLFSSACFNLDPISVSVYDDETIFIEFKGEDAALLIGKEGYRYKSLAYLIYNWVNGKYGYKVRLEIAEFLQNQEEMIENYLQPIIERVKIEGRAQTKVLDGILVQIALKRLREIFPNKYVAIRSNREGGRYIIINEFLERR
jgi:spoIIIJ-associated protein